MRLPDAGEAMDNMGGAIMLVLLLPFIALLGLAYALAWVLHLPLYLLFSGIAWVCRKPHP